MTVIWGITCDNKTRVVANLSSIKNHQYELNHEPKVLNLNSTQSHFFKFKLVGFQSGQYNLQGCIIQNLPTKHYIYIYIYYTYTKLKIVNMKKKIKVSNKIIKINLYMRK